jgi:hypothetical protein
MLSGQSTPVRIGALARRQQWNVKAIWRLCMVDGYAVPFALERRLFV